MQKNFFVVWRLYESDAEHLARVLEELRVANMRYRELCCHAWLCVVFDRCFPVDLIVGVRNNVALCHDAIMLGGTAANESEALRAAHARACEWSDSMPESWWRFAQYNRDPDFFNALPSRANVLTATRCDVLLAEVKKLREDGG